MKILFYNHTGKVSGGERVLLTILEHLEHPGAEPVVLCPNDGPLAHLVGNLSVRTLAIDPLVARFTVQPVRLLRYLSSFVQLIRAARASVVAEAPDFVAANSIRAGLLMSVALVGLQVPVVWHAHDLLPRHPLSNAIRFVAFVCKRTHVICVSRAVEQRFRGRLLRWFPKRVRLGVIHNSVDCEKFQPDQSKRTETRKALGIAETDLVIGTVGQLTARKGQLELIEAFAEVASVFEDAKLVIVGEALFNRDFEYAQTLRDVANRAGIADRVAFLGQREDIAELTQAFDVAVVYSRAEPFGLTVLEAMATGTPVIATAVDGIQEIIEQRHDGWLVKFGDQAGLAEALITLISDAGLRRQLSAQALTTVHGRFTTERFIKDIKNFYHGVHKTQAALHAEPAQTFQVKLSAD